MVTSQNNEKKCLDKIQKQEKDIEDLEKRLKVAKKIKWDEQAKVGNLEQEVEKWKEFAVNMGIRNDAYEKVYKRNYPTEKYVKPESLPWFMDKDTFLDLLWVWEDLILSQWRFYLRNTNKWLHPQLTCLDGCKGTCYQMKNGRVGC